MTRLTLFAAATIGLIALSGPVAAACFADYKAKQDNPLRLHYGVLELRTSACDAPAQAADEVRSRIARGGWELLNVVSLFGEGDLEDKRDSAGEFFLRF